MRYFTVVFILLSFLSRAQTMQGIVKDGVTGMPLFPVIVVNETTQQASTSNDRGYYTIQANPGDIIAFSFIGYLTAEKTKTADELTGVNVAMQPTDYELKEFRVKLGPTKFQIDSAENRAIYKIPLERTHPNPIMNPASAIAEKFSKRAKTIYRFQKTLYAGEIEKFIDTRYSPTLVTTLTGLTGDSIGHFMYAFPMPYDFARTATDLEVKMWIRSSFREWSKNVANDSLKKND